MTGAPARAAWFAIFGEVPPERSRRRRCRAPVEVDACRLRASEPEPARLPFRRSRLILAGPDVSNLRLPAWGWTAAAVEACRLAEIAQASRLAYRAPSASWALVAEADRSAAGARQRGAAG